MLAGGAEASVTRVGVAAFNAMRALSTRNDDPEGGQPPVRPRPRRLRDGRGGRDPGAREPRARRGRAAPSRSARCSATASAATPTTSPSPTPPARRRPRRSPWRWATAGVAPDEVDYVNAHATSTPVGDSERGAGPAPRPRRRGRRAHAGLVHQVDARPLPGRGRRRRGRPHGAGDPRGACVPPTINLDDLDPECEGVDHVANARARPTCGSPMSTAFGFGGHNAILVLGRHGGR